MVRAAFARQRTPLTTRVDEVGDDVNSRPPEEQPRVPLLILLAAVLGASAILQVPVLFGDGPTLLPKPVSVVIIVVALLGMISIARIIRGIRHR